MHTEETAYLEPGQFYPGRLVECTVVNIARKKPTPEQRDTLEPLQSDSKFLCPYCKALFIELNQVSFSFYYEHHHTTYIIMIFNLWYFK